MKTKFLLGALALPMFFAACTNEELMEAPVNANLQNRIPLGDVTLDFGGIDSRLALKEGSFNDLTWSNGDDLGASLIDVMANPDSEAETAVEIINQYNLTTTPQTNYRYEYNDGSWTSNAAMVEGNYVFYMPYIENTNRVAPMAVLPIEQTLEQVTIDGETAYSTYNSVLENAKENGNIMAVAYKFLTADGENNDGNKTISINFKQIYATPLISIQNYARDTENQLTDLTIKKIVLKREDDANFTVKQRLNFTANDGFTATSEAWTKDNNSIVDCLNTVLNPDNEEYKGGSWALSGEKISNTVKRSTADLLGSSYTQADRESASITINIEEPITIASTETFSFYATIPGGAYDGTNGKKLKVVLVTTDGKQVDVTMPAANFNPGKRYAVEGYDAEGNVDGGATAFLAVTTKQLENEVFEGPQGVAIATQAELYAAIATAQKVDHDGNPETAAVAVNLQFIPAAGVTLNDQVISMLNDKAADIASVEFNGDMTVSGLTTTTTVPVSINGKATLSNTVKTAIAATGAASTIGIDGAITVAASATVELSGAAKGAITNNGTLTIVGATTAADHITNNSVLNLKANLSLAAGKDLTNAAEATINSVVASTLTANKVINNGTIAVSDDDLTVTAEIENKGIINAANDLSVTGVVVNKENAEMNISAAETAITGVFTNEGTVTIAEGATLTAETANSINKNVIDNAGTLSIDMNIGTINVTNSSKFGTSSTTVVSKYTNAQGDVYGNIYNPYAKTIGTNAMNGTACQYVWNSEEAYTGTIDWIESDGTFNAVKYNGATVNAAGAVDASFNTKLIYVEFNGNSKLAIAEDKYLSLPVAVQVNTNELEVSGATATLDWNTGAILTVAENAVLGWNDAVNFGTVTIENAGKVYANDGTTTGITQNGAGQYLGAAW